MSFPGKVSSIFRSNLFCDRVAIVTGGGTGIGAAIVQELVHLGCKVVIASRKLENLQSTAKRIVSLEEKPAEVILPVKCNIRKEEEVKSLFKATLDNFGRIDYLVNNGGGQFISKLEDVSTKGWNAVVETNLTGTFLCCREAYHSWMNKHGGTIVNIVMDLWNGFPMMGHSSAARAGVENLTKTMSLEWVHAGIRINSIAPGVIYSDSAAANYGQSGAELFKATVEKIPMKRCGTVEEVAALAMFLLSPGASFISGETVRIDGAQSLYGQSFNFPGEVSKIPAYTWRKDDKKSKL